MKQRYDILDRGAYEFGQSYGGLWLGVPVVLALLVVPMVSDFVTGNFTNARYLMPAGGCGILWITLPGSAFVSAALCACPPISVINEQDVRAVSLSARAMFKRYASSLLIALTPGALYWIYHISDLCWHASQSGRPWPIWWLEPFLFGVVALALGMYLLNAACRAGSRWGDKARHNQASRSAQFLARCWGGCQKKLQRGLSKV